MDDLLSQYKRDLASEPQSEKLIDIKPAPQASVPQKETAKPDEKPSGGKSLAQADDVKSLD